MFERLLHWCALAAGAVLLGLMGLVLFDVLMRYVLRLPFLGAYEMSELAMVLIVFLALPYCAATDGHVAVDLLSPVLDRPQFRWITVLVHIAGAALTALMAWHMVLSAANSHQRGEATNMLKIAISPFELVSALGLALLSAVFLMQAWRVFSPSPEREARR